MVKMTAVKQDGATGMNSEMELPFNSDTFEQGAELARTTDLVKFVVFTNLDEEE